MNILRVAKMSLAAPLGFLESTQAISFGHVSSENKWLFNRRLPIGQRIQYRNKIQNRMEHSLIINRPGSGLACIFIAKLVYFGLFAHVFNPSVINYYYVFIWNASAESFSPPQIVSSG